jgi:hypothetical protein
MLTRECANLTRMAGEDHTLRIWLNESAVVAPGEIARLNHKQSLVTACWMDTRRILVLTRDGVVLLWTRSVNVSMSSDNISYHVFLEEFDALIYAMNIGQGRMEPIEVIQSD